MEPARRGLGALTLAAEGRTRGLRWSVLASFAGATAVALGSEQTMMLAVAAESRDAWLRAGAGRSAMDASQRRGPRIVRTSQRTGAPGCR